MKKCTASNIILPTFYFRGYSVYFFGSINYDGFTKAMIQNLEFIADKEALKKYSRQKNYQLTLLRFTKIVAITNNHFYQSLIKKRIIMLNKINQKKSIPGNMLVLPALVAFVFLFQVKVVAQEKESFQN
jgi:beta-lactamase regulating signal transducer with metallopeptidase domain